MAIITFTFEDKELAPKTVVAPKGLQLVEVCEENDIHLNHNCGEVCACSTCHVYIKKGGQYFPEISDREEDFIDRAINPTLESRLACQCFIQEENIEIEVQIPLQSKIIGHEH